MTRTVSSKVVFDCNFTGCPAKAQTPGPLPNGWAEIQLNELLAEATVDEKTKLVMPEQRATNSYHLCPTHIPKLEPE